jgi:hypothetical protein
MGDDPERHDAHRRIRLLLVGSVVFLSEGIRKLSYPDVLGSEASPNQYSLFRTDGPFMRVEYLHQLLSGSYTQGQWIF